MRSTIRTYNRSGGGYFTFTLFGINPLVFGSFFGYKLVVFLIIVLTFVAIHLTVAALFSRDVPRSDLWIFSLLVTLLFFQQMPSIVQCIYWMTGTLAYQLPNLVALVALSLAIYRTRGGGGKISKFLLASSAILLAFMAAGGSIPNWLTFTALLGIATFVSFRHNLPHKWLWLCMLLVVTIGVCISLAAPGNVARSAHFPERQQFFRSLILSTAQIVRFAGKWLSNIAFILATLLYIPIAARLAETGSHIFRNHFYVHPIVAVVFLLFILYAGFFPPYWAMGSLYQHRTVNVSFFWFLLSWFMAIQITVSYLKKRGALAFERLPAYFNYIAIPVISIALLTTGNTGAAFYDLLSKDALYYNRELEARYNVIANDCVGSDSPCVLEPLQHKPATLFFLDIGAGPDDERNICLSRYFQIKEASLSK